MTVSENLLLCKEWDDGAICYSCITQAILINTLWSSKLLYFSHFKFRTPDVKSQLNGKDPDAGKDWGQAEKRATEDEMVDGITNSMEKTLGDSEGQGSLACCSPWGCKELDTTKQLNNNKTLLYNTEVTRVVAELRLKSCFHISFYYTVLWYSRPTNMICRTTVKNIGKVNKVPSMRPVPWHTI